MGAEAVIRGENFVFTLRVDRYVAPQLTSGSDANWLHGAVELEISMVGSYRASQQVSPFASDLEAFRDELRALDRDLTGTATLAHLEGEFEVTIALESGKGTLSGYVREHIGPRLQFDEIKTDQTYVNAALKQFEALTAAFPVRGDPAA